MSGQIPLDLPHVTAMAREDFLEAPGNAKALALIDRWPDWPSYAVVLVGPEGSGKTHLAQIWRCRTGAAAIADPLSIPVILAEDCDRGVDEKSLFHALNFARQGGGQVLMTARAFPASWPVALPDLVSRLKAVPVTEIGLPDDALLRSVLVKLFADRQIAIDESAIGFLLTRMPRALGAARDIVAVIDRRALAERAEVTRTFISRVLSELTEPGLFDEPS